MNTHDVRFVLLKVQQRQNEIHMEISRRIGIIFGRHSGIFPRSREKVNNGSLILTCLMGRPFDSEGGGGPSTFGRDRLFIFITCSAGKFISG